MHPNKRRHAIATTAFEITLHQGEVHIAMHMVLIGDQAECAMRGRDAALGDAFHGALGPQAVPDEIGDGADA